MFNDEVVGHASACPAEPSSAPDFGQAKAYPTLFDTFKIGGDVTVAVGPVGRQASANTDIRLNAEILSYSRSKGIFAGASVDGAVVQADRSGDQAMYGNVSRGEILHGGTAAPESAQRLIEELSQYPSRR